MLSSTFYVIVMVLLATEGSASTCSLDEENFQFSISSKRNSSNYRILQVDLTKGVKGTSNNSGDIILDVDYGRSMSSNGELVHLSTSVTVLETPLRRDDYELFPGIGYYKLHTKAEGWETARQICASEDAHLIVISSDSEANVVKDFFSRKPILSGAGSAGFFFAGFHDKYTEGNFVTLTGVSLSKSGYAKWDSGEPNGRSERNYGGVSPEGLLHDIPNEWKLGFICEQEL